MRREHRKRVWKLEALFVFLRNGNVVFSQPVLGN